MKKSLKYRFLLKVVRLLPAKRIMAASKEKAQKLFRKAYKGENIPELTDPDLNISQDMTGGKEVPAYMKHLQLGDYTGLKDVYLSFGGEEVFLAGAQSIKKRLEEFGTHVTLEVGEGMYHSYAMTPFVKDAQEGYRHFKDYISA